MMSLPRLLLRSLVLSSMIAGPGLVSGCSSSDDGGAQTGDEQDVVDIAQTPVKNQSIGNCWTYASVGWVESMHLRASGEVLNLSESYLTYWDWYEKLIREPGSEKLQTGGWFSTATKLFDRYGLMDEGGFLPGEATSDRSAAQAAAESAINTSMTSGRLKKDRSPKTVREELDKAWGLGPDVVANLKSVFGDGTPKTLSASSKIPAGFALRRSSEITVLDKRPNQAATSTTLTSVMGKWQEVSLPSSAATRRSYLRRVQKALHDGHPVIVIWDVSWGSRDKVAGSFPAMKADAKIDGRHMTLLEDYQVATVPNYGLLPAGVTVTDKKLLDAALADQSAIQFFRIKNSWGQTADPSGTGAFKGYADLYKDYLLPENGAPNGLVSFIFPSEYTEALPTGIVPDRCAGKPDATVCGSTLTNDTADKRIVSCKGGLTTSVTTCSGSCTASAGVPSCAEPPPPNPCADVGVDVPGLYCGDSLGMLPSDKGYGSLYSCQVDPATGKWISPATACEKGCAPQPPAVPDRCKLDAAQTLVLEADHFFRYSKSHSSWVCYGSTCKTLTNGPADKVGTWSGSAGSLGGVPVDPKGWSFTAGECSGTKGSGSGAGGSTGSGGSSGGGSSSGAGSSAGSDGGTCTDYGGTCDSTLDCCDASAKKSVCVAYGGSTGSRCAARCTANSQCQSGCCAKLDDGTGACSAPSFCGK